MEKICEFCKSLKPVVYCEADAAHLCLSCDAKVHSANALSYRHHRTLICESCRYQPVYVKCFEHQMFICDNCDAAFHISFQHHRKEVLNYVGSPHAKDLAALWGFDFNELENQFYANKTPSNSTAHEIPDEGSSSRGRKVTKDDSREMNTSLIVQQILALEKLQLPKTVDSLCSVHVKDHQNGPYLKKDMVWKIDTNSPNHESMEELFSQPYSQLDNLTNAGNSHHRDLLWQCKSPVHNNEIWLHSIQDIGVCDEVQCFDDVNTPDIDVTFQNFEDLFESDQEPSGGTVDDDEYIAQLGSFDRSFARMNEKFNIKKKRSHTRSIKNSYSKITSESKFDYNNTGPCDTEISCSQERGNVMKRYSKEKKDLWHEKQSP